MITTVPTAAVSYIKMTGTGHGSVQVRAVFGQTKGAYTPPRDVVHTIGEPAARRPSSSTSSASGR